MWKTKSSFILVWLICKWVNSISAQLDAKKIGSNQWNRILSGKLGYERNSLHPSAHSLGSNFKHSFFNYASFISAGTDGTDDQEGEEKDTYCFLSTRPHLGFSHCLDACTSSMHLRCTCPALLQRQCGSVEAGDLGLQHLAEDFIFHQHPNQQQYQAMFLLFHF